MHSHSSILKTTVSVDLFIFLLCPCFTFVIVSSYLYKLHNCTSGMKPFTFCSKYCDYFVNFFFFFCTELLDKKEKEENEAHHAQCQENKDQPRGESSSSIMSKTPIYSRGKVIEKGKRRWTVKELFLTGIQTWYPVSSRMLFCAFRGCFRGRRKCCKFHVRYIWTRTIRQRRLKTRTIPLNRSSQPNGDP